ncbi:MAG: ABC transporter ATP-binding protein [Aquisalinus sp.]|nr:ABC transporter ATP-binding protein [Aquisalinus sp.]
MSQVQENPSASKAPVLALKNITRAYGELRVLEEANLAVERGEIIALLGPSGSGKSSLLHIAALLEAPTLGEVYIQGRPTAGMTDTQKTAVRRNELGFVYQFHHLLPEFNALTNVAIPQIISGKSRKVAEERARKLLTDMGLAERLTHQPAQLSGGEKQRVAIARALANQPSLLLADEPTGNLDVATSGQVFEQLLRLVREQGLSAIIATHDRALAQKMDRIIAIHDRKLVRVRLKAKEIEPVT